MKKEIKKTGRYLVKSEKGRTRWASTRKDKGEGAISISDPKKHLEERRPNPFPYVGKALFLPLFLPT